MLGAIAAYVQGSVELAAGDADAALVSLRRALQVWQELGAPYEAARARVLVARRAARSRTRTRRGWSSRRRARSSRSSRARPDLRRVDALMRDAGRRRARLERPRARGAAARRRGQHEPRDRRDARPQRAHRRPPRPEHLPKAARLLADGRDRVRLRARPRLTGRQWSEMTTAARGAKLVDAGDAAAARGLLASAHGHESRRRDDGAVRDGGHRRRPGGARDRLPPEEAGGARSCVLDAEERIGDAWRQRWDSLRLFTPAKYDGLPGMRFPAPRWSFPTKDEMGDYLEAYAARFELPVRTGVFVDRVYRDGDRYVIESGLQTFEADNVVVATGAHRAPKRARVRVGARPADHAAALRRLPQPGAAARRRRARRRRRQLRRRDRLRAVADARRLPGRDARRPRSRSGTAASRSGSCCP